MSRMGLMVDRCISPASIPVLIDLGPLNEKPSRDRADALMAAGIGRSNFSIEGFGRLLVKLPKLKIEATFKAFPMIVPGSTYFQTTHHWRGLATGEKIAEVPKP